jgi:hypothetical protein
VTHSVLQCFAGLNSGQPNTAYVVALVDVDGRALHAIPIPIPSPASTVHAFGPAGCLPQAGHIYTENRKPNRTEPKYGFSVFGFWFRF